jgi:hypothetical protein
MPKDNLVKLNIYLSILIKNISKSIYLYSRNIYHHEKNIRDTAFCGSITYAFL